MINSKNWRILADLYPNSISSIAKTLNILEYANFSRIANIDNYRYDNTGEIRTNVHRTNVRGEYGWSAGRDNDRLQEPFSARTIFEIRRLQEQK